MSDLLRIDDLAEGRVGGGDGDGVGGNLNGRGDGGGVETEIKFARFVDLQAEVFGLRGLKALELHVDGIQTDGKQIHDEVPAVIRLGFASDTGALGGDGHGSAGNGGAGLISDRSRETADRLTVRELGKTKCSHANHQDKENSLAH